MSTEVSELFDLEDTPESPSEPVKAKSKNYPNVVRTVHGDVPADVYTPSDFANYLTLRNISKGRGVDGIVQPPTVMAALTAVRHPLPVVLVIDSDGKERAFLGPDAEAAWDSRPVRGTGESAETITKRSTDELLKLAGQAVENRDKQARLLAKKQAALAKAEEVVAKYGKWLSDKGLTWNDVTVAEDKADSEEAKDSEE